MKKTSPSKDFKSFGLSPPIYAAIETAGFKKPTDVQFEAMPAILEGRDVLARAETGSGKTAAYVLPLLERLLRKQAKAKDRPIRFANSTTLLILVPTRELAIQIREEFERFSQGMTDHNDKPFKFLSVYGGVKINPQMLALRGGADALIATPGRLLDLERNNAIRLHQVDTLIIDEVDRLMKGDFEQEIDAIIGKLSNKRQNLMFTATFPESIRKLVRHIMQQPTIINIDDYDDDANTEQRVIMVNRSNKNGLLAHLLKTNDWKQVLIFCSAKKTCDNLVRKLAKRGIEAHAMHGNLHQYARARALKDFKADNIRILIATDVAGRGIDIEDLPCIINYELPRSPNDYIHRIGRTGRAGKRGLAISLIAHHEFQHFGVIEKRNGIRLQREQIAGFEADETAPETDTSANPKKKAKAKKVKTTSKSMAPGRRKAGSTSAKPAKTPSNKKLRGSELYKRKLPLSENND